VVADRYSQDVSSFGAEVDAFVGPHFNKEYRRLIALSLEIQCNLDQMDHHAKDKLREKKKELIDEVDRIIQLLKSRVHGSGPCNNCEVSVV
jgi:hypothetical protein